MLQKSYQYLVQAITILHTCNAAIIDAYDFLDDCM